MKAEKNQLNAGLSQYPSVRLQDAIFKYPPDWEAMEEAVKAGVDVNMYYEDDSDDTYLAELYFCYVQNKIGILEENEDWHTVAKKNAIDGQYLPRITKFFLDHGFDVNRNHHAHGGMALYNLLFSSYDGYMLECARLLLDAGADPFFHPYGENQNVIRCAYDELDFYNENGEPHDRDPIKEKALEKMITLLEYYAEPRRIVITPDYYDSSDTAFAVCNVTDAYMGEYQCSDEGFYIREETRDELLWDFLEKYRDDDLKPNKEDMFEGFNPYGRNYYTLDSFEKLLDEVQEFRMKLLTDFDSIPKEKLSLYWIVDPRENRQITRDNTEEEKVEYARDNVGLYIDFYDRFLHEMRKLIAIGREENYAYVLVEGP